MMGRDKYRKIVVGMTAELTEDDYDMNTKGEVEAKRAELSEMVDEAIVAEINKFKKKK